MTRRGTSAPRSTRARRRSPPAAARRSTALDGIRKLGFSCFRLVSVYDPEVAYAYRRVRESHLRMATLARMAGVAL